MTAKKPSNALAKKPYTQPKLTTLGDVRTLTQSGTMGPTEQPAMNNMGMDMSGTAYQRP